MVNEWNAEPELVHGEIPTDLDGMYLRNTENPLHPAITAYHPFDGDGMVHLIEFRDGRAAYRNRFIRTDGLEAEADSDVQLWSGFIEMPADAHRTDGWGIRGRMKDASSTDVVVHRGEALTSFYFCGDLYRIDLSTGDTLGKETWNGDIPAWGVSAHPKVDPRTGELLFFAYSKEEPHLRFGVVGPDGVVQHTTDVALPGPRLPHDMAFTEHHVILNDFPLYWRPELLEAGIHAPRFDRNLRRSAGAGTALTGPLVRGRSHLCPALRERLRGRRRDRARLASSRVPLPRAKGAANLRRRSPGPGPRQPPDGPVTVGASTSAPGPPPRST
jgi:carotenoid cleavage dioxygenase